MLQIVNSEAGRSDMAVAEREEQREGQRVTRSFEFNFEHFKWLASMLIALVGIYVLSERRATATDLTSAYLDKKMNEISSQVDRRFNEMQSSISSVQADVKGVTLSNSVMQGDVKALDGRLTKTENAVTVQQQAYNFNFTTRLAAVEARLGIKPPSPSQKE